MKSLNEKTAIGEVPRVLPFGGGAVRGTLILVLLTTMISVHVGLWRFRSGMIMGDPFTYVCQARSMASGTEIADLVRDVPADQPKEISSGPVWNSHQLPDGRFAWTPAPGYPLLLAAALKLGGTMGMLNMNMALLALAQFAFLCLLIQIETHEPIYQQLAVVGVLLVYALDPGRFHQFTGPWREPLLALLLLSALAVAATGSRRNTPLWMGAAGLLFGTACTVKEVSVIYGPALLLAGWVRAGSADKNLANLGVFIGGFLIGVSPLLIKNLQTTGHLLVSLQFVRAAGSYSLEAPGSGLSLGNAMPTLVRYGGLFAHHPLFSLPALAIAVWGAVRLRRVPIAQALLAFLAIHLVVYLQWGGVDRRHLFLAYFPYAFFLGAGGLAILCSFRKTRFGAALPAYAWNTGPAILVCVASLQAMWGKPLHTATRFSVRDAQELTAAINSVIHEPDALVLVNRNLRDVLATHSDLAVVRLQDLVAFADPLSPRATVASMLNSGRPLYFLDCADRDPARIGRASWPVLDEQLLRSQARLTVAASLSFPPHKIQSFVDRSALTVYNVTPFDQQVDRQ